MAAPKENLGPHTDRIINTDGIVISTENILNTQNTIREKRIDFALGDESGAVYIEKQPVSEVHYKLARDINKTLKTLIDVTSRAFDPETKRSWRRLG